MTITEQPRSVTTDRYPVRSSESSPYTSSMPTGTTTIRVSTDTRDHLAQVAEELGGKTLDETIATVLWQRQAFLDAERISKQPGELSDYQEEAASIADVDTAVVE